ncbi:peptide deformylase [candidate division KSB1 bacterium]|nr:peptide deformylase [candidate division KSB1 bacterium]
MQTKYDLKIYPDAVLRRKAKVVEQVDGRIHDLVTAMQEIMYAHRGIGLAAPQVGATERIIIADIGEGLLSMINPTILQNEGQDNLIEGCLSLPDVAVDIQRHQEITISGVNIEGEEIKLDLNGLVARVVQHEIDHLDGILIIDYEE